MTLRNCAVVVVSQLVPLYQTHNCLYKVTAAQLRAAALEGSLLIAEKHKLFFSFLDCCLLHSQKLAGCCCTVLGPTPAPICCILKC